MSTDNISNKTEGIQKLKELAEGIDFCFFCTGLQNTYPDASPMSVQEVDENGHIWFLASKESTKADNIGKDNTVNLFFTSPSDFKFLAVYGKAELVHDDTRIDKYWNKMMEGWFEKGREDSSIVLIRIKPDESHYWDTKHHKLVSYAMTLVSAVTGSKNDQNIEGKIDVD